MPRHPVLHDERRHRRMGILGEQHVVADAEADDNVHVGARTVADLRLRDRVARRLEGSRPDLIRLLQPQCPFVDASRLAADADGLEPLCGKNCREPVRLLQQSDAGCYPDLAESHQLREGNGVFDSRPPGIDGVASRHRLVTQPLYAGSNASHAGVFVLP